MWQSMRYAHFAAQQTSGKTAAKCPRTEALNSAQRLSKAKVDHRADLIRPATGISIVVSQHSL
jgi:hypothetical protein